MILASSFGKIVQPLFKVFGWVLATFYSWIPNYAVAIVLLTLAVMIIVFPITRRGTRSMMRMQLLAPELKKIQNRFKAPAGATAPERQELRQRLNEEMMALYKENGVSPTGGCLPMVLQFPIFWILYSTIRGLTHISVTTSTNLVNGKKVVTELYKATPLYLSHSTRMYQNIVHAPIVHGHGALKAFGIDLADSVRTPGLSWVAKSPFIAMILVAIALQYIQMKQLSGRNPAAAQANPQMQQMQKVFPIVFAVIYISIPAGVNVYFIVSSLFRIGQQEFMYRRDHQIQESLEKLRARAKSDPKVVTVKGKAGAPRTSGSPKGVRAWLGGLAPNPQLAANGGTPPNGDSTKARKGQGGPTDQKGSPKTPPPAVGQPRTVASTKSHGQPSGLSRSPSETAAAKRAQPRAQGKRARRPR